MAAFSSTSENKKVIHRLSSFTRVMTCVSLSLRLFSHSLSHSHTHLARFLPQRAHLCHSRRDDQGMLEVAWVLLQSLLHTAGHNGVRHLLVRISGWSQLKHGVSFKTMVCMGTAAVLVPHSWSQLGQAPVIRGVSTFFRWTVAHRKEI